jgi:hypothetical protein
MCETVKKHEKRCYVARDRSHGILENSIEEENKEMTTVNQKYMMKVSLTRKTEMLSHYS